jgi:signal transduction histidine kinase
LLGNAVKFTEKGYILVKSQVEELSKNINGRVFKVLITVEDTVRLLFILADVGELASKKINSSCMKISVSFSDSRLFRAFSQLDNSNKRSYGGTGLGLAICEKVIDHLDKANNSSSI